LRFFGHIACNAAVEDRHDAVAAVIQKRQFDLRKTSPHMAESHESDLIPRTVGLLSTWKKASCRENWRSVVYIAILITQEVYATISEKSMP